MKKLLIVLAVVACSAPAFANLLVNGSFETAGATATNALYWDGQSSAPVLASSAYGNGARENWNTGPDGTNKYYLKGTWNGGPNFGGIWQRVDGGVAGQEYTLSGYFYTDGGFAADASQFKLEFYDSSDAFLGSATTNLLGNIGNSTWTPISIVATAPANTAHLMVVFEESGANGSGVLGGDNFALIPEPSVFAMMGMAGLLIVGARKLFSR